MQMPPLFMKDFLQGVMRSRPSVTRIARPTASTLFPSGVRRLGHSTALWSSKLIVLCRHYGSHAQDLEWEVHAWKHRRLSFFDM